MRWDILGQRSSNGQDTRDYFSTRVTMSSRTLTQPGLMQTAPAEYHQTHTVFGLPACPLCGWKSMVMLSRGTHPNRRETWGTDRRYYVMCEHCDETTGSITGPERPTSEEAGKAFSEAMRKYSRSFCDNKDGAYD